MSRQLEFLVETAEGSRLDRFLLSQKIETSPTRSQIAAWIKAGKVEVNSKPITKAGYSLSSGDKVSLFLPQAEPSELIPDPAVNFQVIFEDDDLLVINKQAGLTVHPGAGRKSSTLVHGLLSYLGPGIQRIGDKLRPGLVHRLDKDTSGLLVVAKSELAYRNLIQQLKPPRTMRRVYLALTFGLPKKLPGSKLDPSGLSGRIDLPLARHARNRLKMAVVSIGKAAATNWRCLEHFEPLGLNLLELELETGRTHQIRVHLEHARAPIIGDPQYGPAPANLPPKLKTLQKTLSRQALHASQLSFLHPRSREPLHFSTELPQDMRELIQAVKPT